MNLVAYRLTGCFICLTVSLASAQNGSRSYYRHFEGTIDQKYRIQMDLRLTQLPFDSDSTERFEGFYHYESKGILLNLAGRFTKGAVELEAYAPQGSEHSERFAGYISDKGLFKGTWQHQGRRLGFELQETYASGSVRFQPITHSVTTRLKPSAGDSPTVSAHYEFLMPTGGPDAATLKFLRDTLAAALELVNRPQTTLAAKAGLANAARKYVAQARREMALESLDADSVGRYNREYSETMHIAYNARGLVSVGLGEYEYTGGAHGNYSVTYYVYDLPSRKVITQRHLFKPGNETVLRQLLIEHAKLSYGLSPAQKLTEGGFFEDTLPLTANFYLTNKTVTFCYAPYEVAPYAMGVVQITVPYERLKPLLRETSPVRRFWTTEERQVVAR